MCLIWGREPGCAPGGAVTFSCLAKRKSPKRRRPYCACPFAALRATCDARSGGAPQNSLRACSAPFKQLRRVSARSACVLRHTHAPPALRFSARTEGNPQPDIHTGHRFARPRLRGRKRLALRYPGRTQRWPVWLLGCWAVGLLGCWAVGLLGCWAVGLLGCHPPSVCAWGAQEAGWRGCAAGHTRASSTDSPRLSERSAAGAQ